MTPIRTTTIPVFPSTHVRVTRNELWIQHADPDYLNQLDVRKNAAAALAGKKTRSGLVRRQRQIQKALAHKEEVQFWLKQTGYKLPNGYFAIWFMVPMPKSWRAKKRAEMNGKPHTSTPDWDNFSKQLFDAMRPKKVRGSGYTGEDDKTIHTVAIFKRWCEYDDACIKIVEYDQEVFENTFKI